MLKTEETVIRQFSRVGLGLAALFLSASPALAQQYPRPFPRPGAKLLQENDLVAIWDVTWEKGQATPMQEHKFDQISVTLSDGAVKVARPDKTWTIEETRFASVDYQAKGTIASEEGVSDKPRRAIVVEIKSYAMPHLDAKVAAEMRAKGVPPQFPREGAVKLFETEHFIVWDNFYKPGKGAVHAHYNQDIAVFIQEGNLRAVSADGKVADGGNSLRVVGRTNFRAPGPAHQEEISGPLRAMYFEFK